MSRNLVQSHRTMGYEIARTTADDGRELVILQTAPHKEEASPAHMLRPVTPADVAFKIRVLLDEAIQEGLFLGLDRETLAALFAEELNHE